jgi:hypothetical protein
LGGVGHDADCEVMNERVVPRRASYAHVAMESDIEAGQRGAPSPADRIRERIAEERTLYNHYLTHARKMLEQEDLHGLWDAAANASEVSNRIDGLTDALKALEGRE